MRRCRPPRPQCGRLRRAQAAEGSGRFDYSATGLAQPERKAPARLLRPLQCPAVREPITVGKPVNDYSVFGSAPAPLAVIECAQHTP